MKIVNSNLFRCALSVFSFFSALLLVVSSTPSFAAGTPFLYSGFAFAGDNSNRKELYRYTSELAAEEHGGLIDRLLREKIHANPTLEQLLSFGTSNGKTDTTSLAFALVQENTETQKIDGKYWSILTLQANVLAFNRSTRSVVASYPLRLRSTEVKNTPPTSRDFKTMVREAFTSTDPKENILDIWLNRVQNTTIHQGARKYLRVTNIVLSPEAEHIILASGKKPLAIQNQVANLLESSLSAKTGIPLVPNSVGEAIGRKMMLSFSNGDALQLTLPEADYAVTFTIRDFVSKKLEQAGSFQNIYRSKAGIAIRLAGTERTFINENIYDTQIITHSKHAGIELNDWDQYYKSLQSLIFGLGSQLVKVDSSWLEEHASNGTNAKKAFEQAHKLAQELQ